MTTVMSQVATDSVVLESKARVKKLSGKLAGAYTPGQVVYMSAQDVWTASVGTASQNHYIYGVVEFKKRTSEDFGQRDIDDTYAKGTAMNVEIIVGPRDGTLKIAVKCLNLSAAKYFGFPVQVSSGGQVDLFSTTGSGGVMGWITEEGYTSGDTIAKIYLGGVGGLV